MDFLQFLNNGYDPRLIMGYGGLGYRPPRVIEGTGRLTQVRGSQTQTQTMTIPPQQLELDVVKRDEKGKIKKILKTINYKSKSDEINDLINSKKADVEDVANLIRIASYKYSKEKEEQKEKEEERNKKYKELIKQHPQLKFIYENQEKEERKKKIEENTKARQQRKEEAPKKLQELKEPTLTLQQQFDFMSDSLKIASKIKTTGENKILKIVELNEKYKKYRKPHNLSMLRSALQDAIKFFLSKAKNVERATSLLNSLNPLYTNKKFKIENNNLVVEVKEEGPKYEYDKNLDPGVAEVQIKKYWEENKPTELETDEDLSDHINLMIEEITNVQEAMFDELMKNIKPSEMKKIYDSEEDFYNFELGKEFMKTIVVNGKKYFYKTVKGKEVFDEEKAEKEFYSSGKPGEFSICGVNNPNAKMFYGVKKPNFQITDYIIENLIGGGIGKQFPIDNIDQTNKIFNEMKSYNKLSKLNYARCYNANISLKKCYYNTLLQELKEIIKDYIISKELNNKKQMKILEGDIETMYEVLTNKNSFDLDFYKNRKYCGVGITMNKFNPVSIPEGYDFEDSPSTKKQIEKVASRQGQKFIPNIKNKYVVGMVKKSGEGKAQFDKGFKELISNDKYKYLFTCVTPDGVCVYNYTEDDDVKDDFILGTYKCGYSADDREGNYNGVIIPIEKFKFVTPKPK